MAASKTRSAQVRDQLIELLRARNLTAGDRFPTEAEIAELCNVGRSTAREALKLLEQDGIVLAERGRGRFLSSLGTLQVERPITRFESTTSMLESLGYDAKTMVLSATETTPDEAEREALGPSAADPLVRREGWRGGAAATTNRCCTAWKPCPGTAFPARSSTSTGPAH
jgi:GntR family transcriptional regulator